MPTCKPWCTVAMTPAVAVKPEGSRKIMGVCIVGTPELAFPQHLNAARQTKCMQKACSAAFGESHNLHMTGRCVVQVC